MKINPTLEAFFVAIALQHGTHPKPTFGIARNTLAQELSVFLQGHPGANEVVKHIRKNFRELGRRDLMDASIFWMRIGDAYLDWLYSQEESQKLLPEALAELEADRAMGRKDTGFRGSPFRLDKKVWW